MANNSEKHYKDIDIFTIKGVEPIEKEVISYPYVSIIDSGVKVSIDFFFSSQERVSKKLERKTNGFIEKTSWIDDNDTRITEITVYQKEQVVTFVTLFDETVKSPKEVIVKIVRYTKNAIFEYMINEPFEISDFFLSESDLNKLIRLNKSSIHMTIEKEITKYKNQYWRIEEKTTHFDFPSTSLNCYLYKTYDRNWYWTIFHFDVPDTCK